MGASWWMAFTADVPEVCIRRCFCGPRHPYIPNMALSRRSSRTSQGEPGQEAKARHRQKAGEHPYPSHPTSECVRRGCALFLASPNVRLGVGGAQVSPSSGRSSQPDSESGSILYPEWCRRITSVRSSAHPHRAIPADSASSRCWTGVGPRS